MRRLWRPVVDRIVPYEPGPPLEALARELGVRDLIRLSANESPLGPSPRVIEAITREAGRAHLYPDGGATALRQALGERLGVGPEQIVVGNGADELLGLLALAAFEPGDEVVVPHPSFEPYTTVVELAGATVVTSP
ncbi:MAG: aminotransferase class I/II-fold pyridoxal phosphate-dependent enzyme, partial [Candidatus Rokubacteria bacterium]|nr:aminotransferase class I/II-fold pyridoxal phosphate-dependent enzyme [Candidatus Rokubacteria bacterium]